LVIAPQLELAPLPSGVSDENITVCPVRQQ
jgi:hypothetical protein